MLPSFVTRGSPVGARAIILASHFLNIISNYFRTAGLTTPSRDLAIIGFP
jgi:hypothetical protein